MYFVRVCFVFVLCVLCVFVCVVFFHATFFAWQEGGYLELKKPKRSFLIARRSARSACAACLLASCAAVIGVVLRARWYLILTAVISIASHSESTTGFVLLCSI